MLGRKVGRHEEERMASDGAEHGLCVLGVVHSSGLSHMAEKAQQLGQKGGCCSPAMGRYNLKCLQESGGQINVNMAILIGISLQKGSLDSKS